MFHALVSELLTLPIVQNMAVVIQKWMTTTTMIRTLLNMKSTQRAVAVNLCLHHLRMTLRQSYLILEKLFSSQMMDGQA